MKEYRNGGTCCGLKHGGRGCRWQWWWSVKAAQPGKVWAVRDTYWQGFQPYRATDVKIPDAGTCLEHTGGRTEARVAGERVNRGSGKRWGQWGSLKIVTSSKDFGFYSERGPIHPSICPFIENLQSTNLPNQRKGFVPSYNKEQKSLCNSQWNVF